MEPGPAFLLKNDVDTVRIGRRVGPNEKNEVNDKVCRGINVSRNHLLFIRSGNQSDWQNIRWCIKDLGGMCGTFVNTVKIQANTQTPLNCGDKIGIGCPNGNSFIGDVDRVERFVYMIKSPEAYRLQAVTAADVMEQDAPTPPPVDAPEEEEEEALAANLPDVVTASRQSSQEDVPIAHPPDQEEGPSRPQDDSPDSPIPPPRSRKRSRHLMSSDDEDSEEAKAIKKNFKKMKETETAVKPKSLSFLSNMNNVLAKKCSCRLPLLRLPSRATGAIVGQGDKVVKWNIVDIEEYKRWSRKARGLPEDGSGGTPLLVELALGIDSSKDKGENKGPVKENNKDVSEEGEIIDEEEEDDLSLVDSDEDFSKDNIFAKPMETSPVSSEDEDEMEHEQTKDKRAKNVKQEPRETPTLNYSLLEDVITIIDSDDEEGYNQSQNVVLDEDHALERTESPDSLRSEFSEGEMSSDALDFEGNMTEEDEDEIQILNESQTPLFTKILNASKIKSEPEVPNVDNLENHEEESQSLLESLLDDVEGPDDMMIRDVAMAVDGANETLVKKVYKRLHDEGGKTPSLNDILPEVVVEVERKLVIKMSLAHGIPMKSVEVLVINMKGDDQGKYITEKELERAITEKKEEEAVVDKFRSGSSFSNDIVKEAVLKLRQRKTKLTEESLMNVLEEFNERQFIIASLADKLKLSEVDIEPAIEEVLAKSGKLSEEAVEDVLQRKIRSKEKGKDQHEKLLSKKSKELAEIFNTSIDEARESLTLNDFDEDKAFSALQSIQDKNKSKEHRLSETFNVSLEEAKEVLGRHNGDLEAASQDEQLIMNLESEAVKDNDQELMKTHLPRSTSPNLLEDSDSIDDLLKDDEEEVSLSNTKDHVANDQPTKHKPMKLKLASEVNKPKLIDPLPLSKRRGTFSSSSGTLPPKKLVPSKSKNEVSRKPESSSMPESSATKKKSKEEMAEERKQRLRDIAEKQAMKKVEKTKVDEAPAAGVMKTSIPKNQRLLLDMAMENSEAGPSSGRKRHNSNKEFFKPKVPSPPSLKSSAGFLETEAKKDKEKLAKKEKYSTTSDGYKTVKKMTTDNVSYSVMSQDISKKPMPHVKPFQLSGLNDEIAALSKKRKSVRWRDESGFEPLVDTRYIEAANKGIKCGPGNKDLLMVR